MVPKHKFIPKAEEHLAKHAEMLLLVELQSQNFLFNLSSKDVYSNHLLKCQAGTLNLAQDGKHGIFLSQSIRPNNRQNTAQ